MLDDKFHQHSTGITEQKDAQSRADRNHFAHLREGRKEADGGYEPPAHLEGALNMVGVGHVFVDVETSWQRSRDGRF